MRGCGPDQDVKFVYDLLHHAQKVQRGEQENDNQLTAIVEPQRFGGNVALGLIETLSPMARPDRSITLH